MNWLTDNKIPIGDGAAAVFDWLQDNGAFFFDALSDILDAMIDAILWVLQTPHPLIIVLAFTLLTYVLQRSWKPALLTFVGFLFILNQGYWEETTESLTLVLSACVVCMGIGVPIGIAAAHRPRLYAWMRPVLDLMQTLPTFVYLIPAIVFFGMVIAALVGADGLGVPVVRALNQVNTSLGFESGFIIVVVAIMLDRMLRVGK